MLSASLPSWWRAFCTVPTNVEASFVSTQRDLFISRPLMLTTHSNGNSFCFQKLNFFYFYLVQDASISVQHGFFKCKLHFTNLRIITFSHIFRFQLAFSRNRFMVVGIWYSGRWSHIICFINTTDSVRIYIFSTVSDGYWFDLFIVQVIRNLVTCKLHFTPVRGISFRPNIWN